jgi:hypothetical protein
MSEPERPGDAWYMRWIVHACVLTVLLLAAVAIGVDAQLDEWPPDRAVPKTPVRLTGTQLEPAPAPPPAVGLTATTPRVRGN